MTVLCVVTGIALIYTALRVVDEQVATDAELFTACLREDVGRVERLLSTKPSLVSARSKQGFTPLHYAVMDPMKESARVARVLIARGADINASDNLGFTPLQMATLADNTHAIATLREHGAEL